ncbi:MAG: vanadium-dependent haloperoxidase [Verrucomicrobiales bacterium]|nr:vanadium-dependent haloperoxidase [Verrucomicrobiales bacterium]
MGAPPTSPSWGNPRLSGRPRPGRAILRTLLAAVLASLSPAVRGNPVVDWCALMLDAIRTDTTNPTLSSRNLAILGAAAHDAVQSIVRTHQPYLVQLPAPPGAHVEAAAMAAGHGVMLSLYPGFRARTEELFSSQQRSLPTSEAVTQGLEIGREAARRLLAERGADGSNTEIPYIPSDAPGHWRRTPPYFRPPLTPHWGRVRTFCLPSLEPFRPAPPPPLDSREYAEALNEVKRLGGKLNPVRTPEQTEIASFWSDFNYTAMPPGHWHEIAASLALDRKLPVPETSRLLALIGLAQADAAIVCWDAKYRWNLWRPVTAIRRAAEDGNPLTEPDPSWEELLIAPPFPAYTSGHSSFSKASAQVLTHFFGTDALRFTARSDTLPGVVRSFESVAACADEVGMSRIYGGIHFSFDNTEGKKSGGRIGDYVFANFLLPVDSLPQLRVDGPDSSTPTLWIHGFIGGAVSLESSPDLLHWTPVQSTNAPVGGLAVSLPPDAGDGPTYYRASATRPTSDATGR